MKTKNNLLLRSIGFFSFAIIGGLLLSAPPALADQTTNPAINSGAGPTSSYNWAGYISTGGSFTSVSGTWTVPQPTNTSSLGADATWVGIGGVSGNDLIQTGTQAITNASGQVTYQAWYELLPGNSQIMAITVNPGDSITASIAQTQAGQWTVSLVDNTNGQNFQTAVPYNSSLSSAEWIEEMPSSNTGLVPLDNFGSVQFNNAFTVKNGYSMNIAQSGAQEITMLNSTGQTLASPSPIDSSGAGFTITRSAAQATPQINTPSGRRGWIRAGLGEQDFTRQHKEKTKNQYGNEGFGRRFDFRVSDQTFMRIFFQNR